METKMVLSGFAIVVADRGFVYVGDVTMDESFAVVSNARNIRIWGTTKGLGELAIGGPTAKTELDAVGTVRIPARAVISIIDSEASKWALPFNFIFSLTYQVLFVKMRLANIFFYVASALLCF